MVRAVLFDLDDTLYDTSLLVRVGRENAVRAMVAAGLGVSEEVALGALRSVVAAEGPNFPRHYDEMLRVLGLPPSPKIVAAGVVAYHDAKREYLVPYPDTVSALSALRKKGYRTGVVTDGVPIKQWEKLIRLRIADLFDAVVVASEREWMKPSAKPFLDAAKALGAEPGECLMVGDRIERDVAGAKAAGMDAVLVVRARHSVEKSLVGQEPDYIISKLGGLPKLLEKI